MHFSVISARFGQAKQEQDLNTTRAAGGGGGQLGGALRLLRNNFSMMNMTKENIKR